MEQKLEELEDDKKMPSNVPSIGKNISLAMNLCNTEIASQWIHEKTVTILNPLVVILGIGEYDGMPNIIGIKKDYQNMIIIFNKLFKYDILYKLSNNNYNKNQSQGNINDSFKLKWDCDEIDDFIDDVKIALENENKKYDSLIFIVSSHGEADGVILDSESEEYSLFCLYAQFNGSQFPNFAHCPKLFFVDACRGNLKSKKIAVSYNMGDNINVNNIDKSQEIYAVSKGRNSEYKDDISISNNKNNKNNNSSNDIKRQLSTKQEINIHSEANFFFVYANPDGYAAFDGGNKGGYLIQAIYKVFKKKEVLSKNLDSIVLHIADKVKQLVGRQSMQHVQTVSNVHYRIKFRQHM